MNKDYLPSELLGACGVKHPTNAKCSNKVSIAMALDQLAKLATSEVQFEGEASGLDALCYHLDGFTVDNAIEALNRVKKHFKVMQLKDMIADPALDNLTAVALARRDLAKENLDTALLRLYREADKFRPTHPDLYALVQAVEFVNATPFSY